MKIYRQFFFMIALLMNFAIIGCDSGSQPLEDVPVEEDPALMDDTVGDPGT